ncbi:hypothetical protein SAMN05216293_3620 [Flagellimonas taeanensis]|uniref:Uncharacterized protein n=1 Tax=Flagellimonas taeanensis TaxID=1005926 RepID=A0A1M7B8I8_9FLAO|nr:hypothetical protein SAMN05216293_3620 [Allomuricauda taeanensis]
MIVLNYTYLAFLYKFLKLKRNEIKIFNYFFTIGRSL